MVDIALNIYDDIAMTEDFGSGAVDKYESITVAELVLISRKEDFSNFLRSYPFVQIVRTNLNVVGLGSGYNQIVDLWGDSLMAFEITFPVNKYSEALPILEFYQRNYGKQAFFTNPLDSVQYNVRIADDSYRLTRAAYNTYFANITLVEEP